MSRIASSAVTDNGAAPAAGLDYCCPRCWGPVESLRDAYRCGPCGRDYPVILGIPDSRVCHAPSIDDGAAGRKGPPIAGRAPAVDFPGLVEYYWSITPGVPADLVRRYVRNAVTGEGRGRHL